VTGHGLTEYLDTPSLHAWHAALDNLDEPTHDGKVAPREVRLQLQLCRGTTLAVDVVVKPSHGGCSNVVGKVLPRSLWEDVQSGPVWLQQGARSAIAGTTRPNRAAVQCFGGDMAPPLREGWELGQAVMESWCQAKEEASFEKQQLDRVTEEAEELLHSLDATRQGKAMEIQDIRFHTCGPTRAGNTVVTEVLADIFSVDAGLVVDGSQALILGFAGKSVAEGILSDFNLLIMTTFGEGPGWQDTASRLQNKPLSSFASGKDLTILTEACSHACTGKAVHVSSVTLTMPTGNGKSLLVSASVHPWYDSLGEVAGWLIEAVDMSTQTFYVELCERLMSSEALSPAWQLGSDGCVELSNTKGAIEPLEQACLAGELPIWREGKSRDDEAVRSAFRKALTGRPDCTVDAGEVGPLLMNPRLDILGRPCGVLASKAPLLGLLLDFDGVIINCTDTTASMLGYDSVDELLGREFLEVVEGSSQERLFMDLLDIMESGKRRVVECDLSLGELSSSQSAPFLIDGSLSNSGGEVLLLLQAVNHEALKASIAPRSSTYKSRKRLSKGSKHDEGVELSEMTGAAGYDYHKFQIEQVNLQHTSIGGALGNHDDAPTVPMYRMFYELRNADTQDTFNLKDLHKWLLRTSDTPNARPEILRNVNAFQTKRIQAIMKQMDADGDGEVTEKEFDNWWTVNVATEEFSMDGFTAQVAVFDPANTSMSSSADTSIGLFGLQAQVQVVESAAASLLMHDALKKSKCT